MKLSIMTMNLFNELSSKYQADQDMVKFIDGYQKMMELIAESGYQAIDVTANEVELIKAEKLIEITSSLQVKISSFIYIEQFAAMDQEGNEERIRKAKHAVDVAASLGTKVFMLVAVPHEGLEACSMAEIHKRIAAHWIPITSYAKEKGLYVVTENFPVLKLHLCRTAELQQILAAVPGLELLYDSGNMILAGEDPVAYYDTFAHITRHIHVKDMRCADEFDAVVDVAEDGRLMTCAPTGTGLIDFPAVIEHIKNHGYDGYLAVEYVTDPRLGCRETLIRSREYLEKLLK